MPSSLQGDKCVDRILLILDLDETLIFGSETPLADRAPDFHVGPFSIYKRPYLSQFLETVGDWFDLAVWSSASSQYVLGISDQLFAQGPRPRFVWACDRCTRRYHPELQEHFYAKNLRKVRKLGVPLERILMIDDSPAKLWQNYGNHIAVRPFTGDPGDTELRDLLPFLSNLRDAPNVRRVEKRFWRRGVGQRSQD